MRRGGEESRGRGEEREAKRGAKRGGKQREKATLHTTNYTQQHTHSNFNMRELHGVCEEGGEKGERVGHGPETYVYTITKLHVACESVAIG